MCSLVGRRFRVRRSLALVLSSVLSGHVAGATLLPAAPTATPAATGAKDDVITVVAAPQAFKPGGDQPVPAYLDGQVANGARLGILGEQSALDVPFNVISFTAKMIEDQQAKTLSDVVRNDASVQLAGGYGNIAESYRIRGFQVDGQDISLGGLYGVMPRQIISTQMIDRVEIFKGSNAFLNGVPPGGSGVGGAINLEPKHAGDDPLVRLGTDYSTKSRIGTSVDAGRRFGDNNQFGVRANVLQREGETAVHDAKERTTLASVGLDYRGDRFRASLDGGYQKQTDHGGRMGLKLGPNMTDLPALPDASTNYSPQWAYSDLKTQFGMLRGEYDITENWTFYSAIGASRNDELGSYTAATVLNSQGDASISRLSTGYSSDNFSGMTGIRGTFHTGVIKHNVNVGYSGVNTQTRAGYTLSGSTSRTNIYDPVQVDNPPTLYSASSLHHPVTRSRTNTTGASVSDTLSALDDRVLLTLGARRQEIRIRNYSYTGVEDGASAFDAMKITPAYGLVVKPWEHISLYANHIEALQPGKTAPSRTANAGYVTGTVLSKQNEMGIKADFGRVAGSVALFEIKRPNGFTDPTSNIYGLNGEQKNRGIELNVFGEPLYGVRLLGSVTWIDSELSRTLNGVNDGNDAVGVPKYQAVLNGEWDIPGVEGLTATGTVTHAGSQYMNEANTVKLDSWTRLDLAARYTTSLKEHNVVWRAGVENVTNENYWSSVEETGTYVFQGDPRELKLSMSVDF
ncbi:TonB-dependent receptor [Sodalis sp. RH24]|uniref:TonB-dependent receptor n=1 Tax=unclassified Sodalis (in: enterobacteria) TaxID=2636512 RepID=UPI0039B5DD89